MSDTVQASVLIRESLQWPPASPEDSSDVLYLKAGEYFADLRVYRDRRPATIDWSMAGTCLTLTKSTPDEASLRFINVIDSRAIAVDPFVVLDPFNQYTDPAILSQDLSIPDQYDVKMATLDTLVPSYRETGRMPNPEAPSSERDVDADFEEIWVAEDLPRGSKVLFLESTGGQGAGKAFFARVGGKRLGLCDDGGGVYTAYRGELKDGEWKVVYEIGDGAFDKVVPVNEECEDWKRAEVVTHGGRQWIVREIGVSGAPGARWVPE